MAQSLSNILIHLIFSTKDRRSLILPNIEHRLHKYISTVSEDLKSPVLFINGMPDHIHILFDLSRNITVSDYVSKIKANSSRWVKSADKNCKTFAWQSGYGAFSIGESNRETAIKYIANQKKHHQKISFQDEFIKLLKKYQVEYDEKYLWQ